MSTVRILTKATLKVNMTQLQLIIHVHVKHRALHTFLLIRKVR